MKTCARMRPGSAGDVVTAEAKRALRMLARRHQALTAEIAELDKRLRGLCRQANPALLGAAGVGAEVAASLCPFAVGDNPQRMHSQAAFAALCGASPVQGRPQAAPSDTDSTEAATATADNALWRIALTSQHCDQRTKEYTQRRRAEGKTRREATRCLMRYTAREVYRLLTNPPQVPSGEQLRRCRTRAGLTLTDIAQALNTQPTRISQLERGLHHNSELAERYHQKIIQTSGCQT